MNPKDLVLRKSNIPNAGKGIFSRICIRRDTVLGIYHGVLLTPQQYEEDSSSLYVWEIYENDEHPDKVVGYIDASDPNLSNWTRYVNCCRNKKEENVIHQQINRQVYYIAKRNIFPGEELLIWYGPEYGEDLGITTYS
jgi:hypothetical protein